MPITEPEGKYIAHCILCGATDKLCLIPHRVDENMVGWIFSCPKCATVLYKMDVVISPHDGVAYSPVAKALSDLYTEFYNPDHHTQDIEGALSRLITAYDVWLG